jgi:hypothetical protein
VPASNGDIHRLHGFAEAVSRALSRGPKDQVLAIAVDAIKDCLRGVSHKYDFYFTTGEPYFED